MFEIFVEFGSVRLHQTLAHGYIYSRTGRASFVALLIFAQLGPILLLSIPGGVIADRVDRKKFLISMQAVQLCCSLLLALFAANN